MPQPPRLRTDTRHGRAPEVEAQRHERFKERIEAGVCALHRSLQQARRGLRMMDDEIAPFEQLMSFGKSERHRQPPQRLFGRRPDERRPVLDIAGDQRRGSRRRDTSERSQRFTTPTLFARFDLCGDEVLMARAAGGEHGQRGACRVDTKHREAFSDRRHHHRCAVGQQRHKLARTRAVGRFIQQLEPRRDQ